MTWANIIDVLPAAACLFWITFYFLAAYRSSSFSVSVLLLICFCAYLLAPKSIFALITGASLAPLMMHYLDRIRKDEYPPFYKTLWLVFPTVMFTIGLIIFYFSSPLKQQDYFDKLRSFYRIVLIVENLVFYVYLFFHCIKEKYRPLINWFNHLFRNRPIQLIELQYLLLGFAPIPFLLIALPNQGPYHALIFKLILSIDVYAAAFLALAGTNKLVTHRTFRNITRFNYNEENKAAVIEGMMADLLPDVDAESLRRIREQIDARLPLEERQKISLARQVLSSVDGSWYSDALFVRFKKEVFDNMLFLRPSLNLQDVADILHTNKNYVSRLVNKAFGMGFPELLNILRVDYAQHFLVTHSVIKQSEVAAACGFLSASAFNVIFKKVTGVTPKNWVTANASQ